MPYPSTQINVDLDKSKHAPQPHYNPANPREEDIEASAFRVESNRIEDPALNNHKNNHTNMIGRYEG